MYSDVDTALTIRLLHLATEKKTINQSRSSSLLGLLLMTFWTKGSTRNYQGDNKYHMMPALISR